EWRPALDRWRVSWRKLCVLSDEQPAGLLNLGSWSDERLPQAESSGASAEPTVAAFLDAYVHRGTLPVGGPLNVENDAVHLHG
ncbi:MAG: hypothetical protein M3N52_13885, partial [Actinomycetota bacterium]|nr:hypothetical protein [Actinomycetota bacterium]